MGKFSEDITKIFKVESLRNVPQNMFKGEGPHGSVTQWRILSAPKCVFIGLFSIDESYLVDPVSNHMLVSEINPWMSKFTLWHGETANGSLNHSRFLTCHDPTLKTVAIPELK